MKKIGLIGGTGPESTLVYYRELNRRINEKYNNSGFPELVIESVNLNKALGLVGEEKFSDLTSYLGGALKNLEASGADIVCLTAATMHVVYDDLAKLATKPFISIPQAAAQFAVKQGYKKVGLLGTIFTMERDYLSKAFEAAGVSVVVPNKAERETVHNRIANEFEYGIVKPEAQADLVGVIERMKKEEGIEAVILGCTELPLALNNENSPVPCINIMEIHIQKLVELA